MAPQPDLTHLVMAQLVGHHLCSGPVTKGLNIHLLKAIKYHLGAYWQAFFMVAKQGVAENP